MKIHSPARPGEVIREMCLAPLGLSVTEAAKGLGVSRKALSELVNGHAGVPACAKPKLRFGEGRSPEMAIRLEKTGWSDAGTWLRMQLQFDLWRAEKRAGKIKVTKFGVRAATRARELD